MPYQLYDLSSCQMCVDDATVKNPINPQISLQEVFEAYYECRRHKRRSLNALNFEVDLEDNLVRLWREINNGTYRIGRSVTFIVYKPVMREIFAANFRDRIVHHLIIRKLLSHFEQRFSPNSYSCRKGMGTLYGVRHVQQSIKEVSDNYTRPVWGMKLDLRAFFMSIRPDILYHRLADFIKTNYTGSDKQLLLDLVRIVVFNRPQRGCIMHGNLSGWRYLPWGKSLFHTMGTGLPIGNLTSQIFANFYLTEFDDFVAGLDPGLRYGRYVDDFVLIHENPAYLLSLRSKLQNFLVTRLGLNLHPKKFYMQPVSKGVPFIGTWIKPNRIHVSRRLKKNIFNTLHYYNKVFGPVVKPDTAGNDWLSPARIIGSRYDKNISMQRVKGLGQLWCVANSYLGMIRHYQTYRLRRKMISFINKNVLKCFIVQGNCQALRPVNSQLPDFCRCRKKRRYFYGRSIFNLPPRYINPC